MEDTLTLGSPSPRGKTPTATMCFNPTTRRPNRGGQLLVITTQCISIVLVILPKTSWPLYKSLYTQKPARLPARLPVPKKGLVPRRAMMYEEKEPRTTSASAGPVFQ